MLFEEFGLSYFGPIDGHNLPLLIETFKFLKHAEQAGGAARDYAEGQAGSSRRSRCRRSFTGWGHTIAETGETKPAGQKTYSEVFAETLSKSRNGQ